MKTLALCLAAAAPLVFAAANAAAPFEKIAKVVKVDAFAKADKQWRRLVIARNSDCGGIGNSGVMRIDVIIDAYGPLASAVAANDAAGAATAGGAFADVALQNSRYSSCWDTLSRRADLASSLPTLFR